MDIQTALETIGIKSLPYKRGPVGKDVFAITLTADKIRFWKGDSDITISVDEDLRQAVLNVTEKPRTVKSSVNIWCYTIGSNPKKYTEEQLAKEVSKKVNGRYSNDAKKAKKEKAVMMKYLRSIAIKVPGSRMKVTGYSRLEKSGSVTVNLKFTAKSTTTSFLVGFDHDAQNRPFICQLRDVVSTVKQAHESLKPKNVKLKSGYKRQGEWFFNPVNKELAQKLTRKIHKAMVAPLDGRLQWNPSSHRAMTITHDKKRYAIGQVKDIRRGKHKPLMLDKWHEVVRNNEVRVTNQQSTTWD